MDKILIITDRRYPKKGEKYFSGGSVTIAEKDYEVNQWPIVAAEIEVPEKATGMSYHFRNANMMILENYGVIELSKPKVKRWQWWDGIDGIKIITERYFTEEEIQNHQRIGSYWRKVEGSEVEE